MIDIYGGLPARYVFGVAQTALACALVQRWAFFAALKYAEGISATAVGLGIVRNPRPQCVGTLSS